MAQADWRRKIWIALPKPAQVLLVQLERRKTKGPNEAPRVQASRLTAVEVLCARGLVEYFEDEDEGVVEWEVNRRGRKVVQWARRHSLTTHIPSDPDN
jgi:hypothetical protein